MFGIVMATQQVLTDVSRASEVIISSDKDFTAVMRSLKRRGVTIIVVHQALAGSPHSCALAQFATATITVESLIQRPARTFAWASLSSPCSALRPLVSVPLGIGLDVPSPLRTQPDCVGLRIPLYSNLVPRSSAIPSSSQTPSPPSCATTQQSGEAPLVSFRNLWVCIDGAPDATAGEPDVASVRRIARRVAEQ